MWFGNPKLKKQKSHKTLFKYFLTTPQMGVPFPQVTAVGTGQLNLSKNSVFQNWLGCHHLRCWQKPYFRANNISLKCFLKQFSEEEVIPQNDWKQCTCHLAVYTHCVCWKVFSPLCRIFKNLRTGSCKHLTYNLLNYSAHNQYLKVLTISSSPKSFLSFLLSSCFDIFFFQSQFC